MTRHLVLVHGRSQEGKDAIALKAEWLEAFKRGLAKSELTLPIAEADVRFPFYGDALYEMARGVSAGAAADVIVRGGRADADEERFTRAVVLEISRKLGITEEQLVAVAGHDVVQRGPLNWEWVQAILKAVDRFVPGGSGMTIALFTQDVYLYLKNSAIREKIDSGIGAALTPGVETVVVAHSLGTVAAYNLLRQQGHLRGWKVPLFVTLGSPLAISEIRSSLRSFAPCRSPECARTWFNAMDARDVVALYPLDPLNFPIDPTEPVIMNKRDVCNETQNRHGIAGYLDDTEVARRIHIALTTSE